MFRSLNVAASGMAAQETQLDTIANNLANANTTGYKSQQVQFEDLLYENVRAPGANSNGMTPPTATQLGTGVRVVATTRSFAQGTLQTTNNPLDLAIQGQGFFAVMQPTGTLGYTRAGSLQLNAQGQLTTPNGLPIEPPMTIPSNATSITVAADGTVSVQQAGATTSTNVGQLQLTTFPNPNGLQAEGANIFTPTVASGQPQTGAPAVDGRGTILQGSIESSNVDVVTEMVAMITAQRAYEMDSKVISAADDMMRTATQSSQ
ncbi:MAG: flagellar basal-body rod protein FlgG [Polyangiaceae bacterium]|jgi:flagellar basal-body rod protein FlgG